MNDQECLETYEALVPLLREAGLEWVVDQVDEHLTLGKMSQREVDTFKNPTHSETELQFDLSPRFERGPRTTFPLAIPYESSERLHALIDAVEQAIIITAELETHIIEALDAEVIFSSDVPDQANNESRSINGDAAASRHNAAANIKRLLDLVRNEI